MNFIKIPNWIIKSKIIKAIMSIILMYIIVMIYGTIFVDVRPVMNPSKYEGIKMQDWKDTWGGRYTHSLQYENKLKKPVPYNFSWNNTYEKQSEEYFEHLCSTEAGNYIWKKVKDVESVALIRSFEIPIENYPKSKHDKIFNPDAYMRHMTALEAPLVFNYRIAESIQANYVFPDTYDDPITKKSFWYDFMMSPNMESTPNYMRAYYKDYQIFFNNGTIRSFIADDIQSQIDNTRKIYKINKISSRYAITWKGFSREKDRYYGISGADLIIVDLLTNEILGVQRNFIKASKESRSPSYYSWINGIGCMKMYFEYLPKNNPMISDFKNLKNFKEKENYVKENIDLSLITQSLYIENILNP